ncbi:MAG TPA: hypothetical protein VFX51_09405 [Solirubrobacteraceae bacterium]|nr:hypothetical protein [Solirubrobacteraceae bacterium]
MIALHFQGWWQCRFATDPDPTDDPRGVSGPTFTVPGEPPFDRIIRLQDPVAPRYPHEDDIGVTVDRVEVDGVGVADHPLVGAAVSLEGDPEFLQRNLIYAQAAFQVIVDPFDLRIAGGGVVVRRKALWDVTQPRLTFADVFLEADVVAPRLNTIAVRSAEVAEATGLLDYAGVRARRADDLHAILDRTSDAVARLGLEKRLQALEADKVMAGQQLAATQFMGMQASYAFPLNGRPHVEDPDGRLGGTVGMSQLWPLEFWFGGYDVDALCGYMRGCLSLPFRAG